MAGFEVGMLPVFIRVGNGSEYEVGSFSPTATLDGDVVTVSTGPEFAALLRAVADTVSVEIGCTIEGQRVIPEVKYLTSSASQYSPSA